MAFLIILLALWTYPIISLLFFWLTKNRLGLRKQVFTISSILTILAILSLLTNISTTLSELDWVILSTIYFTISLGLIWTQFQKNKLLKILGFVALFIVFSFGYLCGTIGALAVGFVVSEYDTEYEDWLGDGIIYKEMLLGNAVSNERGKKVELSRTIPWFPIIEWHIQTKIYNEYTPMITTPLRIEHKPEQKKIYLSASFWSQQDGKRIYWNDTFYLSKNR
jgi:hypothetical protein